MAEVVNTGQAIVIVKDWERFLSDKKAEAVRIFSSGTMQVLVENEWKSVDAREQP